MPMLASSLDNRSNLLSFVRDVAQPGSALPWGGRGRWFESSRPEGHKLRNLHVGVACTLQYIEATDALTSFLISLQSMPKQDSHNSPSFCARLTRMPNV